MPFVSIPLVRQKLKQLQKVCTRSCTWSLLRPHPLLTPNRCHTPSEAPGLYLRPSVYFLKILTKSCLLNETSIYLGEASIRAYTVLTSCTVVVSNHFSYVCTFSMLFLAKKLTYLHAKPTNLLWKYGKAIHVAQYYGASAYRHLLQFECTMCTCLEALITCNLFMAVKANS